MAGDSFDEAWIVWTVTQGFAQALDRVIQSLIEINERVSRPDSPSELLPRDDLARMFQQHLQKMEGLLLELYLDALLAQLPGTQIHFEHAEANRPTRWMSALHSDESSKPVLTLALFRNIVGKYRYAGKFMRRSKFWKRGLERKSSRRGSLFIHTIHAALSW